MNNETKLVGHTQEGRHTPTPWSFSGVAGDNYIMAQGRNGRETVAQVVGWPTRSAEQFEANKQFIVRACNAHDDLLAACKAVLDNWEGNLTEAMALVNAAIEKAGCV